MPQGDGQRVRIGQIVGLFGLKGAVKVLPLTDFPSRFSVGRLVFTDLGEKRVLSVHWHKGQVRVMLEGVDSVEAAQGLIWTYLTIDENDRAALGEGEFLVSELIGARVLEGGMEIGTVDDVIKTPAHDLLSVGGALIPFVSQFIKAVDTDLKTVTVELIKGMRPGEETA